MNSNNSNKLLWIVIILTVVMIGVGVGSKVFVDKVADRVIQKLQKDYSPSPYGPGIDPDKLDPEKLKNPQTNPSNQVMSQNISPRTLRSNNNWNDDWQQQRK